MFSSIFHAAYWNVMWSIGSENGNLIKVPENILPHAQLPAEKVAAWYNFWGDYIARKDPYGRPRSFGDAGKQLLLETTAHNNFVITQDPRNYPKDNISYIKAMNEFGEFYWHYGRPVVIGEMCASHHDQYELERRIYWTGFVSGYNMGRVDRHFGTVKNGKLVEVEKFNTNGITPIYPDMKRMADFVESRKVRFWRMRPSDHLIDDNGNLIFCLAAKDEEYIIYFVNGGKVSVELPASNYEWFNPRTGESAGKGCVEAGPASFEAPDNEDWVLHIVAAGRLI
jgi:hypothetical protein